MSAGLALRLALAAAAMLTMQVAQAATPQQLFAATCAQCHGPAALGNPALGAPALAGQYAAYLERQIGNFQAGRRGTNPKDTYGAQMRAIAVTLKDPSQVKAVTAWLASLKPAVVKPAAGADLKNGNNVYQGKCGACHGGRAEGIPAMSTPRLSGLDAAYLTRQFHDFQQGVRGTDPKDTYGRQMAMMSKTLPKDADLPDVIAFIQAQGAVR
ncbi:MAG: c-type cytochrome [Steroidobacteraceae bacterium]